MADGLNKVMLYGNLGADPELRVTPNGQAVLKLRLATNESYLDRNQVRQERVEWHRVTVWGRRAEALAKALRKGSRVFVEGRLQTSTYEKNGEKRYSTEVVAVSVISPAADSALGSRAGGEAGGSSRPPASSSSSSTWAQGGRPASPDSLDEDSSAAVGASGEGPIPDDDIPF